MGPTRVAKPPSQAAAGRESKGGQPASWRGQLQRSLQGEGFAAGQARLAPHAMPAPELRPEAGQVDAEGNATDRGA